MSVKKIVVLLSSVIAIALVGIIWHLRTSNPEMPKWQQVGIALNQQGIETEADYIKFQQIRSQVKETKAISDPDLEWLLALMKKQSTHPEIVIVRVLGLIDLLKTITPAQKQNIFNATVPLLTQDFSTDTYHFIPESAANVLGGLKDQRAQPYLLPLLKSSDPDVKERARNALDKLSRAP